MHSIVIDNLEAIPRPESLLEKLSILRNTENVRILVSSQESDQIAHALDAHFGVRTPLCITDHTAEDIKQFTELHGAALMAAKPQLQEKKDTIMKALHERAQGMFQWVNSALQELNSLEDPRDVETRIDGIRGDLVETYDKIFERLSAGRDDAEVRRIQAALKWIAASATPVTAVDVKIAYMISEMMFRRDQDPKKGRATHDMECGIKRIFDKEESREVAEREVKKYMGTIVSVRSDGTLQFKHPTILRALARPDDVVTPASKFKFALLDAHRDIAVLCMTVCRTTTYVHANSFRDWRMPLVQYAWNFWAYHCNNATTGFVTAEHGAQLRSLHQAHPNMLADWEKHVAFQTAFNKMIDGVTRDAVLYMEALIDFMSRPLQAVSGHFSDREYVLSLQLAQESLIQPTKDLCSLRKSLFDPISSRLQHLASAVKMAADQPCPQSTPGTLQRKAADRVSGAVAGLLGFQPSTVTRLSLDAYLEDNPSLPRPYGASRWLVGVARNLRVTALRLAVDPVYSALLQTAGGTSFSPLHPLVYLAQLFEEAGRYPYWDALPPGTDVLEPFICAAADPEFPSAKFVLHCFVWREHQPPVSTAVDMAEFLGYGTRTTTSVHIDMRPTPGTGRAIGLSRISKENREQIKRLHQMKAAHFYAAKQTYSLLQSDDNWLNKSIINPLGNLHMRFSLAIEEHREPSLYQYNPALVLNNYAPVEAVEAPLKTFIVSIPSTLQVYFVQYIVLALESFGQVARRVITMHWTKVESALTELETVRGVWQAMLPASWGNTADPFGKEIPRLNPAYLIPAAALLYLRSLYFPAWGAYLWYHSWTQFQYAWRHPAAYLELQNELSYGFWYTTWKVLVSLANRYIGDAAIAMTRLPPGIASPWTQRIASTYVLFHSMCTLERSLFAIAAAVATLSACGLVMLRDAETVAELFHFSFFFWFTVFVQLVLAVAQIGGLERGGGWAAVVGHALAQVVVMVVCAIYYVPITRFFWVCAKPARWAAVWVWMNWLDASVATAKCIGMSCLVLGVWKAFWYMHKFLWDPHDVEGSLKALLQASNLVRATLGASGPGASSSSSQLLAGVDAPRHFKRIGWYPLGDRRIESDEEQQSITAVSESLLLTGPPRAQPPLLTSTQSADKEMAEGLGHAVVGLQEYLAAESGFQQDVKRLGHAVDAAVLAGSDGMGRAIDNVLSSAQGVREKAIEAVSGTTLSLRLVGRDLVQGRLKDE